MLSRQEKLGVVFDLDGTLVNSIPMVVAAFKHAVTAFGVNPTADEVMAKMGGPPDVCLRNLLGDDRNVPGAMERLIDYNERYKHVIAPFGGACGLLDRLFAAKTPVALWTGRDRETTSEILAQNEWWKYFQVVVCGDDLDTHKPDPEGLGCILEELSLASSEVIFVGDADVDVLAGYSLDVSTLLIRNGRRVSDKVTKLCREWVETPQQAYDIVSARAMTQSGRIVSE